MKTFKNTQFTTRDYECTNVVACQADAAPGDNWVECDDLILVNLTQLWIETSNGIRATYFGWL